MHWLQYRQKVHTYIYFWSLALLVMGMPLSHFLMSLAIIILASNWIIEGNFQSKWEILRSRKGLQVFLLFYLLFVIGLLHSENFAYAMKDLKIKLPLLALPLIIGTSGPLSRERLKGLMLIFAAAVIAASLLSFIVYLKKFGTEISDTREISLFISHIRFSLQINLAIFILLYYWVNEYKTSGKIERIAYPLAIAWLCIFLLLLKALTGIVIFFIASFIVAMVWSLKIKHIVLKLLVVFFLITLPLLGILYITKSISRFYTIDKVDVDALEPLTANGNPYNHNLSQKDKENGHFVWLYICEQELRTEWNRRSAIDYDSLDKQGHHIKYTLFRYLTSLNLRKDSTGMSKLEEEDIRGVETGMTNYIYKNEWSLYPKIYEIIWQIDKYRETGDPTGSSVNQRIEFLKTAMRIAKSNFWMGVGTGDLNDVFMLQYAKDRSKLPENFRRRAHNQYLTFLLTLGAFGFILCLFTFIAPVLIEKNYIVFLARVFFLIVLLSMINEDTLETHAGVTFVAAFYAILIFGNNGRIVKHKKDRDGKQG